MEHPPYIKLPLKTFGAGAVTQLDNVYIRSDIVFALSPQVRDALYTIWEHKSRVGNKNRKRRDIIADARFDVENATGRTMLVRKGVGHA